MNEVIPDLAGALCRDYDPELWFPEVGNRTSADIRIQVKICGECPVRLACLELFAKLDPSDGIWGGILATEDRRRHRKK